MVELRDTGLSRNNELNLSIIKLINQADKSSRLVFRCNRELGNTTDQNGSELLGDFNIVVLASGSIANL